MSFSSRKSSVYSQGLATVNRPVRSRDNYGSQQTAIRRHQLTQSAPVVGTPAALLPNTYFVVQILRFARTFTGAADTPPTPTASNNYQSSSVFNGSRVQDLENVVRLKNSSATQEATLDIYEVALSYWDALIWDTVRTANSPFTFDTVAPNQGNVNAKTPTATIILDNDWNNFKFQQHYLKKVGTVTISNQDGQNVAEFKTTRIPPKCRRSQTGMYFGYIFHNDSNKNNAATLALDFSQELKFMEIPSELRLPYID